MTKSKEIIKIIEELARHYGKKLITDWMPWILTGLLIWLFVATLSISIGELGETREITTTWAHVVAPIVLMSAAWNVGFWAGEAMQRNKKKDDDAADK